MKNRSLLSLCASMLIFGTIGVFRSAISLPSGLLAMSRGLIGAAFLLLAAALRRKLPDPAAIRKNLLPLCLSGAMIGCNWILLFEAYRYTSVAVATLCYYMAPVFVLLLAPIVLGERLSVRKVLCVLAALLGMLPISGILSAEPTKGGFRGILLGLGAAVLYACVMLTNKTFREIGATDRTVMQLAVAGGVLIPYTCIVEGGALSLPDGRTLLLTLLVGVLHTGFAYLLYFGAMDALSAQTVAIFSYIDPITAILLSAFFLQSLNRHLQINSGST